MGRRKKGVRGGKREDGGERERGGEGVRGGKREEEDERKRARWGGRTTIDKWREVAEHQPLMNGSRVRRGEL